MRLLPQCKLLAAQKLVTSIQDGKPLLGVTERVSKVTRNVMTIVSEF